MRPLIVLALCATATLAEANAGRGMHEGTYAGEPGGLRAVAIVHEDLRFDLRSLRQAGVSATYRLENRGAAVTAPLVFVAGTELASLEIRFAGAAVAGTRLDKTQLDALPAPWRAAMTTPAFDDGAPLGYATDEVEAIAFTLAIPPGAHELVVTYVARPQWQRSERSATMLHQLAYKLVPARDWGSFGTLDVTIEVPPGWEAATSPRLARAGDTLHARFTGLPADSIGITLRAPTTQLHRVLQYTLPVIFLLVLAGGVLALRALGRSRGPDDLRPLWPLSLPLAVVWGVAIAIAGTYFAIRSSLALPAGEIGSPSYSGLGGALLSVLGAIVAVPVGVWIASAARRHR